MADWMCARCRWINRDFSQECLSCGALRSSTEGNAAWSAPGSAPAEAPRSWDLAQSPGSTPGPGQSVTPALTTADVGPYQAPAAPAWFSTRGLGGGLAVAAVAAVVASAIWYAVVAFSSYQIGFVAIAVGWVIGTGAVLGARGRGSLWLVGGSVLLTLIALAVSEYLISYHFVTQELGFQLDLLQPPDFIVSVITDVLTSDPLTLVFWGFAILAAATVPFKAIVPPAGPPGMPDPAG